ncbi:MAG: class I SAM-dependent methyltransferase [bacterium]
MDHANHHQIVERIIRAYSSTIIRLYCRIRFNIININILSKLCGFLPEEGLVADVGCGFGLFLLYYCSNRPDLNYVGYDLNAQRIGEARQAAARLGFKQIVFHERDVREDTSLLPCSTVFMLDLIHHLRPPVREELVREAYNQLRPGGMLIIKDILTRPYWKMMFTYILDKVMMNGFTQYLSESEMRSLLERNHFAVTQETLRDPLPYPHVIYIARKKEK